MYQKSEIEGHANSYLVDGTAWDTITNWISRDNVYVTESTKYGNYINNGSSYTGCYAEHLFLTPITEEIEVLTTRYFYAKNFTNGTIKLQQIRLNDILNKNKENYTDFPDVDLDKNYLDTRIEIPTGNYKGFKLNNIYDMAGNMWEWTTEVGNHNEQGENVIDGSLFAVFRGGSFYEYGNTTPICCRHGISRASEDKNVDVGFRVVLYVQ